MQQIRIIGLFLGNRLNWGYQVRRLLQYVKGKAILLLDSTDPEGSRRLRLLDFKTIGT
jgi:hypothetical protein